MGLAQDGGLTVMGSLSTCKPFRPFPVSILRYKRLFSGNTEMPSGLLRVHDSPPFTVGQRTSWGSHQSPHPRLLKS